MTKCQLPVAIPSANSQTEFQPTNNGAIMGHGKALTKEQKGVILALSRELVPERRIAEHISKSKTAVHNFLWAQTNPKTRKPAGRKKIVSNTMARSLLRHASTGNYSARQLRDLLDLPVSVRRVQQLLLNSANLKYKKMKSAPLMTEKHKDDRYKWACEHVSWTIQEWRQVVFSDEKRFCLDGPDGFAFYWQDLRQEPRIFSKRQQGGQAIMVWAAMTYNGLSNMCLTSDNMDSIMYCNILGTEMLRFAHESASDTFLFQQDGASVHRSNYTLDWLDSNDVYLLPWPAKSPDLNPIENLWAVLARKVYRNQRQFRNVDDLKNAVIEEWNGITSSLTKNLISSMPKRCLETIKRQGKKTHY